MAARATALLALSLLLLSTGAFAKRPDHGSNKPGNPGRTCRGLPYAVPLNNGTIIASEGFVAPSFKLGEEFMLPYKFSPLDIGETVAVKAKSLDPTAGGKEVGYAYWSGVSMGLVNAANPYQAIVNWQVTFVFTQGPGKYSSYGAGSISAVGAGINEGAYVNLRIVGGTGSFCWVSGGQLLWKKVAPAPGAPGELSFYLTEGDK
ncbi:hypothetical protein OEZ86_004541 [Tetradesmus obliquus]|nr:hypothetical protein OEZ86_004541 [Tetradesmus obliquus]